MLPLVDFIAYNAILAGLSVLCILGSPRPITIDIERCSKLRIGLSAALFTLGAIFLNLEEVSKACAAGIGAGKSLKNFLNNGSWNDYLQILDECLSKEILPRILGLETFQPEFQILIQRLCGKLGILLAAVYSVFLTVIFECRWRRRASRVFRSPLFSSTLFLIVFFGILLWLWTFSTMSSSILALSSRIEVCAMLISMIGVFLLSFMGTRRLSVWLRRNPDGLEFRSIGLMWLVTMTLLMGLPSAVIAELYHYGLTGEF